MFLQQSSVPAFQDQIPVFVSFNEPSTKSGTSPFYRIPGITRGRTKLHAFAEARYVTQDDHDEVSIAWRTLPFAGGTVSAETILVQDKGPWADGISRRNTNHNPCPVYDPVEGHLHLLFGHRRGDISENTATLPSVDSASADVMSAIVSPDGDGTQWLDRIGGTPLTLPVDYSRGAQVEGRRADWRLFVSGGGHGICMPDGTLLAPGWVRRTDSSYRAIILRYDRATATWGVSGMLPLSCSEASLTWSDTGKLIVNARHAGGRVVATSSDYGATWDTASFDTGLVDPGCFGSILRLGRTGGPSMIAFTNPANPSERRDLEVKLSLSEHSQFEISRRLYPQFTETVTKSWEGKTIAPTILDHYTAYSDLVELDDGKFGFLLEQRVASNGVGVRDNQVISLVRINLAWLLRGPS